MRDPRIQRLHSALRSRPHRPAGRAAGQHEAAVAILVRPHDHLELLLIRRAELHGDPWSGHVALPGGRRQQEDPDLLHTARREVEEEVGIAAGRVGLYLGALDEVAPSSPRLPPIVIAPYVIAVPPETHAVPEPREVQAALWVPVEALREAGATSEITVELPERRSLPSLVYGDYVIWGLTLRILEQFLRLEGGARSG
jgi:8-oxo-dGTP pyrophosphatase MutT (NUDIX family)